MGYEEFRDEVMEAIKEAPKDWRKGQAVFNYIDIVYGVAREVQFIEGIDCFYRDDDETINDFMTASWLKTQRTF